MREKDDELTVVKKELAQLQSQVNELTTSRKRERPFWLTAFITFAIVLTGLIVSIGVLQYILGAN
ncbi:hypothetical protein I6N90_02925 [Paenibacillus sp. GSMTC-2017]|uniref:hypothetical protein n=1 Tax=Paenibacillus sp. GSMTC-2017 TaxID=2794350 RepID=UPI0018D9303B|nr:hypothetical protein [Paenibacillus sp. GSMTC-2017]MBH5316763.1 hypothetical protein [Paenibacillus sp. GSMTC-2017]